MTDEERQKLQELKEKLERGEEKYLTDEQWARQVRKAEALKIYINNKNKNNDKQTDHR